MPLPNYHSARLVAPGKFDKFRTEKNAGGQGIDFIYGIKAGKSEIQAVRFDASKHSVDDVHAWLKRNKKTALSVTPAKAKDHAEAIDEAVGAPAGPATNPMPNEMKEKLDPEEDDDEDDFSSLDDDTKSFEVEAFAAGTHTDAGGHTDSWTRDDLAKIADKYNEKVKTQPAPVTIGHPVDSSPAFGWIESARAAGDKLILKLGELNKDFVTALKNGSYKTRSISMYDDGTIRHLAFLGGMQPAVKGLAPLHFSEDKATKTYTFSERIKIMSDKDTDKAVEIGFFKKLFSLFKLEPKDFADGANTTDISSVVKMENGKASEEMGEGKEAAGAEHAEIVAMEDKQGEVPDAATLVSKKAQNETKTEANEAAMENEKLKTEIASLKSQLEALEKLIKKEAVESSNRAFCERMVSEGRMRPADVEAELANLEAREYTASVRNFSSGETMGVPFVGPEEYKAILQTRPKICEFGEMVSPPDLPPKDALVGVPAVDAFLEKDVKDKMQLDPKISYADALRMSYAEACSKFDKGTMAEYTKAYKE